MTRVAVLLVGALMALSACTGDAEDPAGPVPSPGTDSAGSTSLNTWAELPVGRPPDIPYIRGNRYLTPAGKSFVLPLGKRGVSGVARFSGGLLVSDATYFEGTNGIDLVRHGARVESWRSASHCSSGTPVASADGGHVAWVTVRCPETLDKSIGAVHVARADGSAEVTQAVGPGLVGVVGFLNRSVVYNVGFQDGAWITGFDGHPRPIPGVDRVQAVSQATQKLIGEVGDRARLVVDADGTVRWRARTGDLVSFSPDGTRVLSMLTRSRISVLHTHGGQTAASVELPAGADVWSTVWETNQTLLTVLRHDGKVAIVRVYLDGHIERATPAVGLDDGQSRYALVQPPPIESVPGDVAKRVTVPSHCGVLSVTVDGQLWLADPPLGDDSGNPPAGWDENNTMGYFLETGPERGEFHGDGGQRASFRRAPTGTEDPNTGCE